MIVLRPSANSLGWTYKFFLSAIERRAQREAVKQSPDKVFQRQIPRCQEVPMVRHLTLKVYSTVCSKDLINSLHTNSLTLSYDRVLNLTYEMSSITIELYERSGNQVLPSRIRSKIFTMFADNNIDLFIINPSLQLRIIIVQEFLRSKFKFPTSTKNILADINETERRAAKCEALEYFLTVYDILLRRGLWHTS